MRINVNYFSKVILSKRKILIYSIAGLLLINLIFLAYFLILPAEKQAPPDLKENIKIIFLDVGQGDAALIQTGDRQNILIDGGPDKGIIYKLDQYIPFYARQIDLMVLTHPDPDHLNGLIEVARRYEVKNFVYNGVDDESVDYRQFLNDLDLKNTVKKIVWQGEKIDFQNGYLEFIFPFESVKGINFKDDNPGCLVFKLVVGEKKVLFTGDASQEVEKELLGKNIDLSADILKVGHHGSKSSTSLNFLQKIKPTFSVISVGAENKYGHPNLRVLKNLESVKSQILRTDQLGDIIFEINGANLIKK
jgi:competence protein ComEC